MDLALAIFLTLALWIMIVRMALKGINGDYKEFRFIVSFVLGLINAGITFAVCRHFIAGGADEYDSYLTSISFFMILYIMLVEKISKEDMKGNKANK